METDLGPCFSSLAAKYACDWYLSIFTLAKRYYSKTNSKARKRLRES